MPQESVCVHKVMQIKINRSTGRLIVSYNIGTDVLSLNQIKKYMHRNVLFISTASMRTVTLKKEKKRRAWIVPVKRGELHIDHRIMGLSMTKSSVEY